MIDTSKRSLKVPPVVNQHAQADLRQPAVTGWAAIQEYLMKIALVLEQFNVARGGAERSTYELACALGRLGHDVTLLGSGFELEGARDLPFSTREFSVSALTRAQRWRRFQRAIGDHIKSSDYDIVHSMVPIIAADVYQPRGGSTLHSSRCHAMSYANRAVVGVKRASSFLNRARQVRIASERELCLTDSGPVVAALSNYVAEQFKTDYDLPDARLRLIRNGVDIKPIQSENARAQSQKLRQLYDPEDKLALFLFAAENLRLKGLGALISAVQRVLQSPNEGRRDLRVMVVSSQDYRSYWQQARDAKLDHRIIFMGSSRKMPALLHMCDAVVLPTYNDACSRIVLEALAAGKPAITTRFNGAAEFLDSGTYGIVIGESGNIDALADALLTLCDRGQHQKMTRAIQADRLGEKVSIDRHAEQLVKLYQELLCR